jgi:hypothetical protein
LKGQKKSRENLRFEEGWKSAENAIVKSQCSPKQPKKMDPDQNLIKCNPLTLNESLLFLIFRFPIPSLIISRRSTDGMEIEFRKFFERKIRSKFCDNGSMWVSEGGLWSSEKRSTASNLTKVSEKVRDGLSAGTV